MHRQATICHEVVESVNCLFDQVLNVTMFKKKKDVLIYVQTILLFIVTCTNVFGSETLRFQAPSPTLYI